MYVRGAGERDCSCNSTGRLLSVSLLEDKQVVDDHLLRYQDGIIPEAVCGSKESTEPCYSVWQDSNMSRSLALSRCYTPLCRGMQSLPAKACGRVRLQRLTYASLGI